MLTCSCGRSVLFGGAPAFFVEGIAIAKQGDNHKANVDFQGGFKWLLAAENEGGHGD